MGTWVPHTTPNRCPGRLESTSGERARTDLNQKSHDQKTEHFWDGGRTAAMISDVPGGALYSSYLTLWSQASRQ